MIKFLIGFFSGGVYGILYMANDPNIVVEKVAMLIKALF